MENIKSFENYADQCPKGGKHKWCRGGDHTERFCEKCGKLDESKIINMKNIKSFNSFLNEDGATNGNGNGMGAIVSTRYEFSSR